MRDEEKMRECMAHSKNKLIEIVHNKSHTLDLGKKKTFKLTVLNIFRDLRKSQMRMQIK